MKKCPYCAEKIQDEAIVCRYCGRDIPTILENKPQEKLEKNPSIWVNSAKVSAVITVLYFINNAFIKQQESDRFQGNILFGLLSTFFGWWLISALIILLWRKLQNKLLILIIGVILIAVIYLNFGNTSSLSPAPTSSPPSTRNTTSITQTALAKRATAFYATQTANSSSNCLRWDKVNETMIGKQICVFGIVKQAGNTNIGGGQFRIYFGRGILDFFMLDVNYEYPSVKTGDCVTATGIIEKDLNEVLFINLNGELNECSP